MAFYHAHGMTITIRPITGTELDSRIPEFTDVALYQELSM